MKHRKQEQKEKLICEFRYGMIAELLNPYLTKEQQRQLIREKAAREYEIPYSSKRTITEATIRLWLRRYKLYGKNGLLPRKRNDVGRAKSFTEGEQSALIAYMEKHPEVPATTAVRTLQRSGKITSYISQSALSRFVRANGLTREQLKREKTQERNLKFEFFKPLECVQADCMHGFSVPDGAGKKRKAILLAFIDDATRRIIYASFSFSERSYEFERGVKHILKTHGRIGTLYADNGATFVSDQTKRILSIVGIHFIHSRPRKPAGRGKIERFFRTVRDQFLRAIDPEEIKNLEDLNIRFRSWLESEYHRNPHRGIGNKTPLEAWIERAEYIIQIDREVDLDEVFLHEISRKIYKDNTFSLDGNLYEIPGILVGERITLKYDPISKNPIHVYHKNKHYADARKLDTYGNSKIKRDTQSKLICEKERISYVPTDLKEASISASLSASKANGGSDEQ